MAKAPTAPAGAENPAVALAADAYVVAVGTLVVGPPAKQTTLQVGEAIPKGALGDDEIVSLAERGKIVKASDLPQASPSQVLEIQALRDMVNAANARAEAAEAKLAPLQAELDALKNGSAPAGTPAPAPAPAK